MDIGFPRDYLVSRLCLVGVSLCQILVLIVIRLLLTGCRIARPSSWLFHELCRVPITVYVCVCLYVQNNRVLILRRIVGNLICEIASCLLASPKCQNLIAFMSFFKLLPHLLISVSPSCLNPPTKNKVFSKLRRGLSAV